MTIALIDDWKKVLTQAWSVKFGIGAGIFTVLNFITQFSSLLPYMQGVLPDKTFMLLALACGVAGFAARFLKQNGFDDPTDGEAVDGAA